jgi:hypothetical protein
MHAQQAQMLARVRMQMQAQQPAKNADARGPRQAPASGAELTRERSGARRRAAGLAMGLMGLALAAEGPDWAAAPAGEAAGRGRASPWTEI